MKKNDDETNPDSESDWRLITTIGLFLGVGVGIIRIASQGVLMEYGVLFGITISGITASYVIIRIIKKKIFTNREIGFLSGLMSGYFVISYVGSIVNHFVNNDVVTSAP